MSPPLCAQCGRVFKPDSRTAHQKTCSRRSCRRARARAKLRRWRKLHRDHITAYRPKVRAWAKAYPDYWQTYRREHPRYASRDNARRRKFYRRKRRSANETAIASISRRKLEDLALLKRADSSANETLMDRRINGIVDYLVWRDHAANVTGMARVATGDG